MQNRKKVNMENEHKKFIITTEQGIEEIKKHLKKQFLDQGRGFDKSSISHLFRIGSTVRYRERDYQFGIKGSNYLASSEIEGCSLLTLFGLISRGQLTGQIYISPPLIDPIQNNLDLKQDSKASNHYFISSRSQSIDALEKALIEYGKRFVDLQIKIPNAWRISKTTSIELELRHWRSMIQLLESSPILKKTEYSALYNQLIKYKNLFNDYRNAADGILEDMVVTANQLIDSYGI